MGENGETLETGKEKNRTDAVIELAQMELLLAFVNQELLRLVE